MRRHLQTPGDAGHVHRSSVPWSRSSRLQQQVHDRHRISTGSHLLNLDYGAPPLQYDHEHPPAGGEQHLQVHHQEKEIKYVFTFGLTRKLGSEEYKQVLGNMKHCILATDLALFFPNKAKLTQLQVSDQLDRVFPCSNVYCCSINRQTTSSRGAQWSTGWCCRPWWWPAATSAPAPSPGTSSSRPCRSSTRSSIYRWAHDQGEGFRSLDTNVRVTTKGSPAVFLSHSWTGTWRMNRPSTRSGFSMASAFLAITSSAPWFPPPRPCWTNARRILSLGGGRRQKNDDNSNYHPQPIRRLKLELWMRTFNIYLRLFKDGRVKEEGRDQE